MDTDNSSAKYESSDNDDDCLFIKHKKKPQFDFFAFKLSKKEANIL